VSEGELVHTGEEKQVFRTPVFEGPLDLLLFEIQESQVNIYDIPISEITEQFLSYVSEHGSELRNLADFYKMGADLLYIKSRMLLPVEVVETDGEYEDPRKELVDRLIEYQKFKKYTELLAKNVKDGEFYIPRKENLFQLPFTDGELLGGVKLSDLMETFSRLMAQVGTGKLFNVYEEVSINEKKALILELLEERDEITISDVIVHPESLLHVICAFMAILVQTKDGIIIFNQKVENGEIYIVRRPKDYDEALADEYEREYDEFVEASHERPKDVNILNKAVDEEEEIEDEEGKVEYVGSEEEIDIDDDDDTEGEDE